MQTRKGVKQGGLTGTVATDDGRQFSGVDLQVGLMDGVDRAVVATPGRRLQQQLLLLEEGGGGREEGVRRHIAPRASQIGGNHSRVGLNFRRRALGQHAAVIQHQQAIRDTHHQRHMVLDQQYGHTCGANTGNQPHARPLFRCR